MTQPLPQRIVRRGARAARRITARLNAWSLPRFATAAPGFEMRRPRSIVNPDRIHLGPDVKLGPGSELKANTRFPGGWMKHPNGEHVEQSFSPVLHIGARVTATARLQIAVFQEIVIEDDVMFAANVFVCDGTHGSETAEVPYKFQGIRRVAPIHIGRGSWIGQNVVILPGVTVGEFAIVGANSVVTRDVPSRCVVMGAPARVRSRWDAMTRTWAVVAADGAT